MEIPRSKLSAFLAGLRSAFDVWGAEDLVGDIPASDTDALGEDWNAVGGDFRHAMERPEVERLRKESGQLELAL